MSIYRTGGRTHVEVVIGVLPPDGCILLATADVVELRRSEVDRSDTGGVAARCRDVSGPRRGDQAQSGGGRNQRIDLQSPSSVGRRHATVCSSTQPEVSSGFADVIDFHSASLPMTY